MGQASIGAVSMEELQLATRNHGTPLEALRYAVTPVGLHYLLIHYDIPTLETSAWRLHVDGCVSEPLELSLADLRAMPGTTRVLTMECAGNGRALLERRPLNQPWLVEAVGTGEWRGVALDHILALAGLQSEAVEVLFTGADRGTEGGVEQAYQRSLAVEVATSADVLLAYDLNGAPLPPQHGFPLRVVVPRWYGMTNVKWLTHITVLDTPFMGYQQTSAYRLRQSEDEIGEPLSLMLPRSLMVPPGIPDFVTRARTVLPGACGLVGRAWSGLGTIISVDVSSDGGTSWHSAEIDPAPGDGAWQEWRYTWHGTPGDHELSCRATDSSGNTQPLRSEWNYGGYINNAVHRVSVHVREP